jgi:EAL domain-containing protein (putative c-di-GMP-specific phosphodiesterase class I)
MECPVRMRIEDSGDWLPAARFVPMARRRQLTAELDLAVVELALEKLDSGSGPVAINLAPESLLLADFGPRLCLLLERHRDALPSLWLELGEAGVLDQFDAFRSWCASLRHLPCRIGLEHVGHRISEIGRLHDLGIDYLKVDASFVRGIDSNAGNRAFLEGLCRIAHAIGLIVMAEGVASGAEFDALSDLGFDGLTGPEVTRRFGG